MHHHVLIVRFEMTYFGKTKITRESRKDPIQIVINLVLLSYYVKDPIQIVINLVLLTYYVVNSSFFHWTKDAFDFSTKALSSHQKKQLIVVTQTFEAWIMVQGLSSISSYPYNISLMKACSMTQVFFLYFSLT